jgi:hypothetical protein
MTAKQLLHLQQLLREATAYIAGTAPAQARVLADAATIAALMAKIESTEAA